MRARLESTVPEGRVDRDGRMFAMPILSTPCKRSVVTTIPDELDKGRILAFLRKGAWFSRMPAPLQEALVDAGTVRTFEPGEVLGAEDRPVRGLYVILQGQALVTRQVEPDAESVIHVGGPGLWTGYVPMLNRNVLAVTTTARTRVRAFCVSAAKFRRLTDDTPEYFRHFAALAAQQLAFVLRQLACSLTLSAEELLRLRLADYTVLWRNDGVDDDVIELAISQSEVARMIGASRQTVNRCLIKLEEEGLIETGFNTIRILDPERLRQGHRSTGLDWA